MIPPGRGESASVDPAGRRHRPEAQGATTSGATDPRGRARPALGRARMVATGRDERDRDYVDHRCPGCDHPLKVRAAYAGRAVACKHCGRRFVAELGPTWPATLPIESGRTPTHPSVAPWAESDSLTQVITYLGSRVAEAGERNGRLEAERRRLLARIDALSAELDRLSGRNTPGGLGVG